jgi:hypothetical protein
MKGGSIHIVILVAASNVAAGQSIHNSTSIFIPPSITVYAGDLENTGFILNSGTIEATGNWNNQNVYQGLGTIVLSGASQMIDNNDQSIQNLLISGAGSKTLSGKLTIDGSIEFASGIVEVGDDDTLLVRKQADIEGGSSISFVDGALIIEGTGYKFFPIGRNGVYHPVSLNDIEGVNVATQLAAFNDMPLVRTTTPIDVDERVYWNRQTIKGSFFGSPISASANISIDDPAKIAFVTGNNFENEFTVLDNGGLQTSDAITFATSRTPVKDHIFALGALSDNPVAPAYLSTTLSPNASNPDNRLVRFFGADLTPGNFHFIVVNRWGNTVFECRSPDTMNREGWNGKDGGQLLPAGAYPYSLSYVDKVGKEQTKRGFITIIY